MNNFFRSVLDKAKQHLPGILTMIGIGGMATSAVMAVKATPEAQRRLEACKEEQEDELTPKQKFEAVWMCYAPSVIVGGASAGCIIASNVIRDKRSAALLTAYVMTRTSLREHKKALETLASKGDKDMVDAQIATSSVDKNPPTMLNNQVIVDDSFRRGNTLCYDEMFGRYFYSDVDTLNRAVNKLNHQMTMMTEPYISVNDYFTEIGLPTVDVGDLLGWNTDNLIELLYSAILVSGRIPCLCISYEVIPKYDVC